MDSAGLDRESLEPLHSQLAQILNQGIKGGTYLLNEHLPSEADLQKTFGVSRSVVRQALGSLASMGLIERTKGSGSRVSRVVTYHRLAQSQMGLAAQLSTSGASTTTRVTAFRKIDLLIQGFDKDSTGTLLVERVRSVNGNPIAFIRTWLPLPLCSTLNADELENASLHEAMSRRFRVEFVGGNRQVRAVSADAELASVLGVAMRAPLLLLEGTSTSHGSRVVEKFATWHRSDLISLDFSLA